MLCLYEQIASLLHNFVSVCVCAGFHTERNHLEIPIYGTVESHSFYQPEVKSSVVRAHRNLYFGKLHNPSLTQRMDVLFNLQ